METMRLTEITSNSDTENGRGHTIVHGCVMDAEIARAIVSDKRYARYCVQGIQHPNDYKCMTAPATVRIFDSVEDFFRNSNEELRKRALAKLSVDEREVLGV